MCVCLDLGSHTFHLSEWDRTNFAYKAMPKPLKKIVQLYIDEWLDWIQQFLREILPPLFQVVKQTSFGQL